MRYLMKQKWFSVTQSDFTITDEEKRECFRIKGKAASLLGQASIRDPSGGELAVIKRRFRLAPTFTLIRDGDIAATVKQSLWSIRRRLAVETADGELQVTGNLWDYEYVVSRNGSPVAEVSKRWFAATDTYGIEVTPDEDDVLVVALVLITDMLRKETARVRA